MKYCAIKDMSGVNLDVIISRIYLYFLPTLLGLIIVIIVYRAAKWPPKAAEFDRKYIMWPSQIEIIDVLDCRKLKSQIGFQTYHLNRIQLDI